MGHSEEDGKGVAFITHKRDLVSLVGICRIILHLAKHYSQHISLVMKFREQYESHNGL